MTEKTNKAIAKEITDKIPSMMAAARKSGSVTTDVYAFKPANPELFGHATLPHKSVPTPEKGSVEEIVFAHCKRYYKLRRPELRFMWNQTADDGRYPLWSINLIAR